MRGGIVALLFVTACVGDAVVVTDSGSPIIEAGPAIKVSVVRNPAEADHPAMGSRVTVEGLVVTNTKTVGNSKLFFAQDPSLQSWAGIVIFTGPNTPSVAPGAVVRATGTYTAYKGLEEIDVSTTGTYTQTGTAPVPAPIDVAIADINGTAGRALELQSMLVRVKDVTATAATAPPPSVEFPVTNTASPGPSLQVSSFYANDVGPSPFPATQGQMFLSITGNEVMSAAGASTPIGKLAPGRASDLVPK